MKDDFMADGYYIGDMRVMGCIYTLARMVGGFCITDNVYGCHGDDVYFK